MSIFHLAIPTKDLKESKEFYTNAFQAKVGREYDHYVVFNFFGHQLVTHLNPEGIDKEVSMYPRHFGIIVETKEDFDSVYDSCKEANVTFFEERFERFIEEPGWHHSFFVQDPSNNLVELKYYVKEKSIFG